jgi:hypothetical protein
MSLYSDYKETMIMVKEKKLDTEKYQVYAAGYLNGIFEGGLISRDEYKDLVRLIDPSLAGAVMVLMDLGEISDRLKPKIHFEDEK